MADSSARFVWYELLSGDAAAAQQFYSAIFGWKMQDAGMPDLAYTLLSAGERTFGGLMDLPAEAVAAGACPAWVGHIGVADAAAALAQIQAAGGQVIKPLTEVPGTGHFAVVSDPQGAVFDLWQPACQGDAASDPSVGGAGLVSWHELCTSDPEAAMVFYAQQFGWTQGLSLDMGPGGRYQLFAVAGVDTGGIMNRPADVPASFWLFYFGVDDVTATIAQVQALGGTLLNGPMAVPDGAWVAQLQDPQGAAFAVVGALGSPVQ